MFHTISIESLNEFSIEKLIASNGGILRGRKSISVIVIPVEERTYYCVRYKSNKPDSIEEVKEFDKISEAIDSYNSYPV